MENRHKCSWKTHMKSPGKLWKTTFSFLCAPCFPFIKQLPSATAPCLLCFLWWSWRMASAAVLCRLDVLMMMMMMMLQGGHPAQCPMRQPSSLLSDAICDVINVITISHCHIFISPFSTSKRLITCQNRPGFFVCAEFCLFRINADTNDLPWPFTVDRFPSLVYFPALDKADSIPYPPHLPLTLPNLVQFVRHAAGPTADIGACSRTCIQTNLRTIAITLSRLQSDRSHLARAICRLRTELKSMFIAPLTANRERDLSESNSATEPPLVLTTASTAGDEKINGVTDGVKTTTATLPTTEPSFVEPTQVDKNFAASELSDTVQLRHSNSNIQQGSGRTWCSVERLLRMRDELATLRRYLHSTEVKRSLLRHIYTYVLLPAAVRGSRQLERRRWQTIRRRKLVASLRLRNYCDLVSGWDMGSTWREMHEAFSQK